MSSHPSRPHSHSAGSALELPAPQGQITRPPREDGAPVPKPQIREAPSSLLGQEARNSGRETPEPSIADPSHLAFRRLFHRLQTRLGSPPTPGANQLISKDLDRAFRSLSSSGRSELLELLAALDQVSRRFPAHLGTQVVSPAISAVLSTVISPILSPVLLRWPNQAAGLRSQGAPAELLCIITGWVERLSELTSELAPGPGEKLADPSGQIFHSPSDEESLYIETSGLVILWPFLEKFFERLGLMDQGRFVDTSARHRAVGLLYHLATGSPQPLGNQPLEYPPLEYQVVLGKALCGLDMDEVFHFGAAVTPRESEECRTLITAAIDQAPILKHLSIEGFRGSFLLRSGVLTVDHGAWLLTVERASFDVVVDQLPWGLEWIKYPWMNAPMRVQW